MDAGRDFFAACACFRGDVFGGESVFFVRILRNDTFVMGLAAMTVSLDFGVL